MFYLQQSGISRSSGTRPCPLTPGLYTLYMGLFLRLNVLAAMSVLASLAADPGKALLSAARNGDAAAVKNLTSSGARLEIKDKKGRTPLMLAAASGHADTVKLLLEKGADPNARDKDGLTAYSLALFSLSGSERDAVLAALPKPARVRVNLVSGWSPENVVSSCFLSREALANLMTSIHPDGLVSGALITYARTSGMDLVEILAVETRGPMTGPASQLPPDNATAAIALNVRPGTSCVRDSDNLSLAIDVRVTRAGSQSPIFEKTFGGGLRGLHAQSVTNIGQYQPFLEQWAEAHAASIYWGVVKALMK